MTTGAKRLPMTLPRLRKMAGSGEKIACLTAYDATFAHWLDAAGVDVVLVGDSLGNVVQGHATTVPVTVDDIAYHSQCVARGLAHALLVADLPFLSYTTTEQAIANAARVMQVGGAHMVKLEGGENIAPTVARMTRLGIPVCAHLGLLPQSIYKLGSYRVQGRDPSSAEKLVQDAEALVQAGADLLVLECVPADLAARLSGELPIPVVGIGAGAATHGQILVLTDVLGITPRGGPRFARDFMPEGDGTIAGAIVAYVRAVKAGLFPNQNEVP